MLCLGLRLLQNFLALLLYTRELLGVARLQLLNLAVGHTYAVTLLRPVTSVACNLAQLTLKVDMVATRLVARRADNILRQTNLAGNLYGKRATRLTLLQLKERAYVLHIEHHSAIGYALRARCVVFNIRVVRSYHSVATSLE